MKSLLQEGSSIIKAIEAAWTKVGMPAEFSVKIMRDAETSFFGLATKNSAIISLSYGGIRNEKKPNEQRQHSNKEDIKKNFNHNDILEKVMRDTKELQAKSNIFGPDLDNSTDSFFKKNEKKEEPSNQPRNKSERNFPIKKVTAPEPKTIDTISALDKIEPLIESKKEGKETQDHMLQQWSLPMTEVVMNFLHEIFNIIQLDITLSHEIDGLQLHVTLSKPVFEDADQEYKLYTSLAFLMIQKIKKDFRKKCKGYRVVFHNAEQNATI